MPSLQRRLNGASFSVHADTILSNDLIKKFVGARVDGVIGQLTEVCEHS